MQEAERALGHTDLITESAAAPHSEAVMLPFALRIKMHWLSNWPSKFYSNLSPLKPAQHPFFLSVAAHLTGWSDHFHLLHLHREDRDGMHYFFLIGNFSTEFCI